MAEFAEDSLTASTSAAEECKVRGNEKYRCGDYRGAVAEYTKAIGFVPNSAPYHGNRSAAYMMLSRFEDVIQVPSYRATARPRAAVYALRMNNRIVTGRSQLTTSLQRATRARRKLN